jgi:hypothetical protein
VRLAAATAALAIGAAACGGSSHHASNDNGARGVLEPTTKANTTTTAKPVVLAPLTGLPEPSAAAAKLPALTVKIDNTPHSRPQVGIDAADVVYEEVVECGITRLAAIFQSQLPPVVGAVRSVRRTDQALVRPLRGIFVYSGGAAYAEQSIATAPVVRFNETTAGSAMYRDSSRSAPYNLFLRPPNLEAHATGVQGPPHALFAYEPAATAATQGLPANHAEIGFQGGSPSYAASWDWDPVSHQWLRSQFGVPDDVASGARLAATNVVIQTVAYTGKFGGGTYCGDIGAQADLASGGDVIVLTEGRAIRGRWSHPDPSGAYEFVDAAGRPIRLAPGRTWVELPSTANPVTVTAPPPASSPPTSG